VMLANGRGTASALLVYLRGVCDTLVDFNLNNK
jgi:hypothetical protein